ncbi:MAG: hypothetical protein WA646_02830, partial [Candidatus Sulfotelmatobacter sp.]
VFGENDFFSDPVIGIMSHRVLARKSNLGTLQVSHFERQTRPVVTSYNSFGFTKVANVHDLSRHPTRGQKARKM